MGRDVSLHGFRISNREADLFSVYPNTASCVRILFHGVTETRVISQEKSMPTVFIVWSRDGNLDATRGVWFHPNHFIPLLEVDGDTTMA